MKVLFIFGLMIVFVCAQENTIADAFMKKTLAEENPNIETVIENSSSSETSKDEKAVDEKKIDELSLNNGEKEDEVRVDKSPRIASGVDATVGENLDYVLLTIFFYNQMQTCGGILVHPRYVLTTATCVKDPVEGIASIINATFPQRPAQIPIAKLQIFVHENFDQPTYANDVALIKLANSLVPDGKTLAIANISSVTTTDVYVNQSLRLCGFGSISNYYTRPQRLKCTDLFIQPAANCSTLTNTICSFWTDRDNNACNNDYGSGLYLYSYENGRITQTVVGMASYAPDYRPNAPCFDGHKVVHVQVASYMPWPPTTTTTTDPLE